MSDEKAPRHHHTLRERLNAAHAAAEEVVAEESGQIGSEVGALAVPFEELAAAVRAAINPHELAEDEVVSDAGDAGEPQAPAESEEPAGG